MVEKFKGKDQANQSVPALVPLQPAVGQDLTTEDLEKIRSALGDGTISGLQEQLGQGLSSEDLQRTLEQAEALACALEGRNWDVAREICN